jgi:hypothetical protein
MKLSTEPIVWRTAIASIVAALITAGVLSPEWGEKINTWAGVIAVVATALLPIGAALWARMHTAPVQAGTPKAKLLALGADGVYHQPSEEAVQDARRNLLRRNPSLGT